jgi:hypothetical protein
MIAKKSDADEKPEQTVITQQEYEAQQFAAHLLGQDGDGDPLPTKTTRTPGKVKVLNAFNIAEPGPIIDEEVKAKSDT